MKTKNNGFKWDVCSFRCSAYVVTDFHQNRDITKWCCRLLSLFSLPSSSKRAINHIFIADCLLIKGQKVKNFDCLCTNQPHVENKAQLLFWRWCFYLLSVFMLESKLNVFVSINQKIFQTGKRFDLYCAEQNDVVDFLFDFALFSREDENISPTESLVRHYLLYFWILRDIIGRLNNKMITGDMSQVTTLERAVEM